MRDSPEWTDRPEGAVLLWEDGGEQGEGHGFDNLDPSAFIRGWFRVASDWPTVRAWYREMLEARSWLRHPGGPKPVEFDIYRRGQGELWVIERPEMPWSRSWIPIGAYEIPGTVFEIYRKIRQKESA